jgi:hypothetical protein
MGKISNSFALILSVILAVSILIMAKPAFAQTSTPSTIATPSVPQFTVQPVGPFVIVNTTYFLDANTGKTIAKIGYTNEYSAVNVTIKNPPFNTYYYDGSKDDNISLYYNVRYKIANLNESLEQVNEDSWDQLFSQANYSFTPSDSEYTVIPIHFGGYSFEGGLLYVQVGEVVENASEVWVSFFPNYGLPVGTAGSYQTSYTVLATSGWSNIQTVNVPANIPLSPTPNPSSPTPTVPELSWSVVILLMVSIFSVVLLIRHRKHR